MLKSPHSLLPETPHLPKPLDLPPIELKTLQVVGRWRGLLKVQKSPSLDEAQYSAQACAVSTLVNLFETSDPLYAIHSSFMQPWGYCKMLIYSMTAYQESVLQHQKKRYQEEAF